MKATKAAVTALPNPAISSTSRVAVKTEWSLNIRSHSRRIFVIIANLIFGNIVAYFALGTINRLCGNRIRTIFTLYPANEKYTSEYVYTWYAKSMRWSPRLLGIFKQNRRFGLTFAVSSSEKDFLADENKQKMIELDAAMEKIRRIIGAKQKTYAGILPGIMMSRGIMKTSAECKTTVAAIMRAISKLQKTELIPNDAPIIILGGKGFIGNALIKTMKHYPGELFVIDLNNKEDFLSITDKIGNQSAIILNLTKRGVLKSYAPFMWPKAIVLNEVYPEPSTVEVRMIKNRGAKCYHIVGTKGKAYPSFPRAYRGGIPCCASFLPEISKEGEYEILIEEK